MGMEMQKKNEGKDEFVDCRLLSVGCCWFEREKKAIYGGGAQNFMMEKILFALSSNR